MERLTYKDASGNWVVACNRFWNYLKLKFPAHIRGEAVDRLAAYEETGVEPADVITAPNMAKIACALHELNQYKELGDLDRLRELVEADKDGRCVVLPCKVGEKVYDITMGNIVEKTVISIPFMLSNSVNHLCLHAINKRGAATTIEPTSIGKTVFLNREAAEAALAKEGQNNADQKLYDEN